MELTPRQRRLLDIITKAARAGRVCPTNKTIAEMDGLASASAVADTISRLQRKGLIEVERFNRARIIYLPDLDLQTATPTSVSQAGQAPHWRDREPGVDYSYKPARRQRFFPPRPAWRRKWPWARWHPSRCQYYTGPSEFDGVQRCGRPVVKGSPYCASHHTLCYGVEGLGEDD